MPRELVESLRELLTPAVESLGYELVDVSFAREHGGWVLRVLIDAPGGIAHSDCERVSRELSALLDVHDPIRQAYSLEVSSPGLDRPLRTIEHFRRFVGDRARVRLRGDHDGRRNFAGRIVGVDEEAGTVVLDVDGREHRLPIAAIEKARREHEFEKSR